MLLKGDETLRNFGSYGRTVGCRDAAIKSLRRKGRAGVPVVCGDEVEDQFTQPVCREFFGISRLNKRAELVAVSFVQRVIKISLSALC